MTSRTPGSSPRTGTCRTRTAWSLPCGGCSMPGNSAGLLVEFILPDLGEGLEEAEIVEWLVPEGGAVERDQPFVAVETDKSVVEIPSPVAGRLLSHGAGAGAAVRVGDVLATFDDASANGLAVVTAVPPLAVNGQS